jgi:DNA-binding response OmpR family regulator
MGARILVVDDSSTVRRVVERTLERAGYEVITAADGREALEQAQRAVPDLVLLDLVMPHVNGYQFCQSMRAVSNLREVPVVLMSARADRIAEQFIAQTGAIDAICKPFGPEALLAVTTNALGRRREVTSSGTIPTQVRRPPSEPPEPEAPAPDEESSVEVERARLEAAMRGAERVARLVAPVLREHGQTTSDSDLAAALLDELEPEALFELASDLARISPGERGEVSFRGRIDHVPLGEILQLLQHQQQSGVLDVERVGPGDERGVSICVGAGFVDIALGHGGDHDLRLGQILLAEELIEPGDLDAILARRAGTKRLLGAQLVKLGYISQDDLRRALVRQTSELVYEALRWHAGTYTFERYATRPEATDAHLHLPVASILMEGLRRVDEWRLIEEQIHGFDMVLAVRHDAVAALADEALSPEERTVLDAIDGDRTVRQIVELTRMPSFDACKILFQLVTSGLIRDTKRNEPNGAPSKT